MFENLLSHNEFIVGMSLGFVAVVGFILSKCFYRIDEGHRGVLLTFGAAEFENEKLKKLRLSGPGLHFKMPWQKVHEFALMERVNNLTRDNLGFQALTEDGTLLRLEAKLRMQPDHNNLYTYLFDLKNPIQHIHEYFKCLVRNEIANFKDAYAGIRKSRNQLNERVGQVSREKISTNYGVQFNSVDIVDIVPPEELDRALNAVQNTQADVEALYSRALAERDQKLATAQQAVEIAANRANAAETEIEVLGRYIYNLKVGGVLASYLDRRRTEVFSSSKLSFIKN